ncbi:ABC transporter permease subunit [Methylobacterium sp. Leaf117]|uniref:ABC transporter permease n=1 Tax=Methylobacterium sp. Leaf117 TaxID=1736260 RepID=UPI0006F9AD30|nr:ABC transporter permease subunit [Methylobacterium sp. Leaf117]KQP96896.1 ABC transporter permease [Methylobacterium sp. Leaf117]
MAATDASLGAVAPVPVRVAQTAPTSVPSPTPARYPQLRSALATLGWSIASLGLFAGLWETLWALGFLNPLLLPPPHLFLSDLPGTLTYFDRANRIGSRGGGGGVMPLLATIGWTTMRVTVGLVLGFVGGVLVGALLHYIRLFRNLVLPTVLLLAPISPVAWLPVAIFVFGIGDVPAIFLVFITLFFAIALTTSAQIAAVPVTYLNVARIMGADSRQTFFRVVLPAILPGLFMTLRLNLFAAWMVVLIAEAVGVGSGLGQIVSLARSTFNARLSFFTMAIIGLLGFSFDWALRQIQARMLWWIAPQGGGR